MNSNILYTRKSYRNIQFYHQYDFSKAVESALKYQLEQGLFKMSEIKIYEQFRIIYLLNTCP
jgi:hypothetical protein